MQLIALVVRGLAVIFSAIALALSVVLIHQAAPSYKDNLISFAAFCGAWGIIVSVVGVAAVFVEKIPGLILAGVDGLTSLFFLAAAIAFATQLKVHTCAADPGAINDAGFEGHVSKHASLYTIKNQLTNGGFAYDTDFDFAGRCMMAQADCAFLFFALGCFLGCVGLDFFKGGSFKLGRRGGAGMV